MISILVVSAVMLGALFPIDLAVKIAPPPTTDADFMAEVERIGREIGCYPRDYMPATYWRFVLYVCPSPDPPEGVLFRELDGRWRGVRAVFPDLEYEYSI